MCVAGVSLQLLGRQGDDALCLYHSPVGAELAVSVTQEQTFRRRLAPYFSGLFKHTELCEDHEPF